MRQMFCGFASLFVLVLMLAPVQSQPPEKPAGWSFIGCAGNSS